MVNISFIEMIEESAMIRGDDLVPRDFITEALERINSREEMVDMYPTGGP